MFLLPFFKYLKPFKWRLTFAFACMFLESALGAVSILMLKYPLDILLGGITSKVDVADHASRVARDLAARGEGATLIFVRGDDLKAYEETGTKFDASLSTPALQALLAPQSPLRGGAIIIGGERIAAAGCSLRPAPRPGESAAEAAADPVIELTRKFDAVALTIAERGGEMRLVMEGKGEALAPGADRAAIKGAIETAFMKHPAGHGFSRHEKGEKKEKGSSSLTNLLPEGVRNWFGNTKTGPLHYFNEKSEEIRQWYGRSAHESPRRTLFMLSGLLTALTLIKCLAEYLSNYHTAYAFYFINMKMREDIYRNILAQDYAYFVKNSPGFLISRISSDVGAIKDIIDKILTDGIQEPLNLMAYTLALFYLSPRLTLIVFLITPPLGILIYFFNNTLRKNTKRQKKKADELAGSMSESLFNIRLVKAFGTEEVEIKKYIYRATVLFKYIMNRRLAKFGSGPIMEFLGVLMASGVLVLGGMMILGDGTVFAVKMKPSDFFLFLMLLTRFYRPIKSLSATTIRYQIARVSSERIQEMLSLAPKVVDRADSKPFEGLREGIEFRNVCFRYKNKEILRNVSFLIPKGKIVAVVGKSGAGKTTLANLVPRLYDPSEGAVLLDGVDLRDYRATDIRRRLGIVTQQTILFDDTVANNIAYGADDAHLAKEDRMAKIIEAAKAAYADEFIQQLDGRKGYNTRLGISGTKLSGGQSQRIAIARALYRNPEILILDEATSALDSNAQAQVQAAIDNVIHDRTAIIIAHRFSTIRHADNIIVLRDGELIEQGTHDELMTRQGHYYELYMKDLHRGEGGAEETSAPQEQEGPLPEGEKSDRDQRKKKKRRPEEFVENF